MKAVRRSYPRGESRTRSGREAKPPSMIDNLKDLSFGTINILTNIDIGYILHYIDGYQCD